MKHDDKVRSLANQLKKNGFKVKADIPGFDQPIPISGKIPDIEATKPGTRKIYEVETPASMKTDEEQISTFRRSVSKRPRTTFDVVKTKK